MLPETQRILHSFYDLNNKYYADSRREFKPKLNRFTGEYDTPYGVFPEMEEIYRAFYSLELTIDGDLFRSDYDFAFAHPKEVTKALFALRDYLKGRLERLADLNQKYSEGENYPVTYTYNMYLKAFEAVEYVLGLEEILQVTNKNQIEQLQNENMALKFDVVYRPYIRILYLRFAMWLIFILVPVLAICFTDSDWRWFSLATFIIAFLDNFFSKENIGTSLKLVTRKLFRKEFKEEKFKGWLKHSKL